MPHDRLDRNDDQRGDPRKGPRQEGVCPHLAGNERQTERSIPKGSETSSTLMRSQRNLVRPASHLPL